MLLSVFLMPGYRVPIPELIYLQEHLQGVWMVKRGLSQSFCTGRRLRVAVGTKGLRVAVVTKGSCAEIPQLGGSQLLRTWSPHLWSPDVTPHPTLCPYSDNLAV